MSVLNGQQFGSAPSEGVAAAGIPALPEPHMNKAAGVGTTRPFALSEQTTGSVAAASTWEKPNRVLPYAAATRGSTFRPQATD